jgi:hypothetical protein
LVAVRHLDDKPTNHPGEAWTRYRLFNGSFDYWPFIQWYDISKETAFGTEIVCANVARRPELAAFMRPHVLQRRQFDVLPDLPAFRFSHSGR